MTRDADLAVAVANDREAERIVRELQRSGYRVLAAIEQEATGRLATVRLELSSGPITDLLFASSGIEPEIVASATDLKILPNFTMPVASVGHLIAMKLLARDDRNRPADADDLLALGEVATAFDWTEAATATVTIEKRGFARGRNLQDALKDLRTSFER
jgi:hypothetical protein